MKCDYCSEKASTNYQKVWVRYQITKDGSYELDKAFTGCGIGPTLEDNLHLCENHAKEWSEGKI